jgi:SAM-dependent methyltransferase
MNEPVTGQYAFDNSLAEEAARLRLLEEIADPRSIALLEGLGVRHGLACAELGAGGGSMAAWLSDQVGTDGSVLAVDKDVTPSKHLESRTNVALVESTLEELALLPGTLDLVHARNVLMHLASPEAVITKAVEALRPGGIFLFEEADYYPLAGATSEVFAEVVFPLVGKWTWARTLPAIMTRNPVTELSVTIDAPMLNGGSAEAAFWSATFIAARERLPVGEAAFDELMTLLADSTFFTPFASVICVSGRRS